MHITHVLSTRLCRAAKNTSASATNTSHATSVRTDLAPLKLRPYGAIQICLLLLLLLYGGGLNPRATVDTPPPNRKQLYSKINKVCQTAGTLQALDPITRMSANPQMAATNISNLGVEENWV